MGRSLYRFWLYLWILPVFTCGLAVRRYDDGRIPGGVDNNNVVQKDAIHHLEGSSQLTHNEAQQFNNSRIGLTRSFQKLGTLCNPEDVVDFNVLLQSLTGSPRDEGHELFPTSFYICSQVCKDNDCSWWHHGALLVSFALNKFNPQRRDGLRKREQRVVTLEGNAYIFGDQESHKDQQHMEVTTRNKRASDAGSEVAKVKSDVEITGVSFEYDSDKKRIEYDSTGSPRLLENMAVKMRLSGKFTKTTLFKLTKFQTCDDPHNQKNVVAVDVDESGTTGTVDAIMPQMGELNEVFLCLKTPDMPHFVRQGEFGHEREFVKPWLVIKLYKSLLPLWLHLSLLVFLLGLSGLFSGLNLGLMSLNKTDLKIIINTGTLSERHYAAAIAPVRNHGNFLLCCLLFSNVLVNASLTILVDDLTSGLIAIMMSTLAIVIFGEIIPQAICSRHGLAVGAKTIYITKFFMFITAPLALPLSKLLDKLLGEEIGSVYTRERLKELLRVTKDYHGLANDEVEIISGALDMKSKTVKDVMVRLENAFMLPITTVLDFDTMSDVEYHGYSRIPVFEKERKNIVGLLNIKQLTLLDANDNIPLKTVVEYYQNKLFFVFENTRLDFMLKTLREGEHGHMAFVQTINDQGEGDPYYETIGLLTLEDVLEELLQAEIIDESDIGKHDARLTNGIRPKNSLPFALMKRKPKLRGLELPPPLALATVQFLSTSVEPFSKTIMSLSILQRLVSNCAHYIKLPRHRGNIPDVILYEAGKPSEFFIMILEGRVEVTVGKENLTYESGAFTTFGKDFLISTLSAEKVGCVPSPISGDKPDSKPKKRTFIPDYTVRVVTNLHYLMLKYSAYKAAILATGIEQANADPSQVHSKTWQEEIDRMLEKISSYDEDASSETSRRPRISRDESFRAANITFGDNEGIGRKVSFSVIDESGREQGGLNGNLLADAIYMKTRILEENGSEDKSMGEESKLLTTVQET